MSDSSFQTVFPEHPSSVYQNVQSHYTTTATSSTNSFYGHTVASAFGYSPSDLLSTPAEANLGLSCGNPFAIAGLREGETVIDLGCGAGFDVFQAAGKVGERGRVVGIDMNAEMLARARRIKEKTKAENVSFVESRITAINLLDQTADCVISNCVINLVPTREKPAVFREMFRLLRPGGRVALSDILLKKDLPDQLRSNVALYVGCVAGASRLEEYERYLKEAGFRDPLIVSDQSDLNVYKSANEGSAGVGCCGPAGQGKLSCHGSEEASEEASIPNDVDLNEWAGSFKIYAVKPDS